MAYPCVTVTRVLVNPEYAVPPVEAARMGVFPDVFFIRADGWVLGAPRRLAGAAERMWRDSWVYRLDNPVSPIVGERG